MTTPRRAASTLIHSIALAMAITTLPAQASPGKLNGKGCHNSKKQGYHCHRAQTPSKSPASKPAKPGKTTQ